MTDDTPREVEGPWQTTPEGLMSPEGVTISFQRYVAPLNGFITGAPPSCGALPLGRGAGAILLPVAAAEAFWIGAEGPASTHLIISPESRSNGRLTGGLIASSNLAARIDAVPVFQCYAGLPRDAGGWWSFQRRGALYQPLCRSLAFAIRSPPSLDTSAEQPVLNLVRVRLVSYAAFRLCTTMPPPDPIDAGFAYKDWLLP